MTIHSNAFSDNGIIPVQYTGYGEDMSPRFSIENIPDGTKTLVIIMDDLDVPLNESYNHWVIFNIPPVAEIPENIPAGETIETPFTAVQGIGYGKHQYRGPKPPKFIKKPHRYVYTIYALSDVLKLDAKVHKKDVVSAMEGLILAKSHITGLYGNE